MLKLKERDMEEIIERQPRFVAACREPVSRVWPSWPALAELGLSEVERSQRLTGIGGSDANIILSGDRDRLLALWHEKRGEQEAPDLSSNLAVMLGCWTEAFNRLWYEKISGQRVGVERRARDDRALVGLELIGLGHGPARVPKANASQANWPETVSHLGQSTSISASARGGPPPDS
jgi:hypothetical protein